MYRGKGLSSRMKGKSSLLSVDSVGVGATVCVHSVPYLFKSCMLYASL